MADSLERHQLLNPSNDRRNEDKADMIPLVMSYSRALPDVRSIVRRNENILHNNLDILSCISRKTFMSYRR